LLDLLTHLAVDQGAERQMVGGRAGLVGRHQPGGPAARSRVKTTYPASTAGFLRCQSRIVKSLLMVYPPTTTRRLLN